MADYILIRKSRNVISSILHVVLNILLGVGSVLITVITGSWIIGLILVVISKWRMFAVRPRYWMVNLKSNLVDLIVGASFVFIAYCSGTDWLPVHSILALGYTLWLIVLKPRSSETATEIQAIIAVFLGSISSTLLFASSDSLFLAACCFVVGYSASRHVLVQSDDNNYGLLTLSCGLISAEIAWLCHSWLIVYAFDSTGIIIPQLALLLSIFAFASGRVYKNAIKNEGKLNFSEIMSPLIFSLVISLVIVLIFSEPIFNV